MPAIGFVQQPQSGHSVRVAPKHDALALGNACRRLPAYSQSMGPVFFITGPPGSGKTTVSRLLLERFPKGIHVSVDAIRESVVSGFRLPEFGWPDEVDEQFALARSSATYTARTYSAAGFAVVVDDTLGPSRGPHVDISQHADLLEDATVHRVALRPRLDVVVDRNRRRGGHLSDLMDDVIPVLLQSQIDGLTDGWIIIDSSNQTPQETADQILAATSID
jgi:Chloramphenicol phosphotransferase-like protein